jgi:hypothetical protein
MSEEQKGLVALWLQATLAMVALLAVIYFFSPPEPTIPATTQVREVCIPVPVAKHVHL